MGSPHLSSYRLREEPTDNSSRSDFTNGKNPRIELEEDESSSGELVDPSFLWSASLLYYTGISTPKVKHSALRSALSMSDMHKAGSPLKGSLSKSPSNDSGTGTVSSVGTKGSSSTFRRLSISSFRKRHSSCGSTSTNSTDSMGSLKEKIEKTGSMKGVGNVEIRQKRRSSIASFISRTGSLGRYRKYEFNATPSNNSPLPTEFEQRAEENFASPGPSPSFTPDPSPLLTSSPAICSTSSLPSSTSRGFRESLRVAKRLLPSSKITLSSHSSWKTEDKSKWKNTSQLDISEPLPNSQSQCSSNETTNQCDFSNKNTPKIKNFRASCSGQLSSVQAEEETDDGVNKESSGILARNPALSCQIPVVEEEGEKDKTKSDSFIVRLKQKNRKDKDSSGKEKQSSAKKVSLVKTLGRKILHGSSKDKEKKEASNTASQKESTSNPSINNTNINTTDTKNNFHVSLQPGSDGKISPEMVQFENEPRKLTPKSRERNPGLKKNSSSSKVPVEMEANGVSEVIEGQIDQYDQIDAKENDISHNITEERKPKAATKILLNKYKEKDINLQNTSDETEETLSSAHKYHPSSNDDTAQIIRDILLTKGNAGALKLQETKIDSIDSIIIGAEEEAENSPENLIIRESNESKEMHTDTQTHNFNELTLQESELDVEEENETLPLSPASSKEVDDSFTKIDAENELSERKLITTESIHEKTEKDNACPDKTVSEISTKTVSDDEDDDKEGSYTESFKHLEPFSYDIERIEEGKRERLYKVLVVGELGTGKTSIIKRYVHQFFSQHYRATIGVDFALKVLRWDPETVVRLQLWDIAGQERFGSMTRVYYKEAVGAFVVFDVTRAATLEAVPKWKADLDTKVVLPDGRPIPTILLANKSDQPKEGIAANREKMNDFCQQQGFSAWFETSAKDNINIDESANFLVSKILEMDRWSQEPLAPDPEKLDLSANGKHKAGGSGSCAC